MQLGIDSFVTIIPGSGQMVTPAERVANLLEEEAEAADRAGLDTFGIGEHHREEFIGSAPAVLFGAMDLPRKVESSPEVKGELDDEAATVHEGV